MRIARNFAALVALATVGFAVGDFASHPNPLGAIGLLVLIGVFGFLLSYLFRTDGRRRPQARPAPEPEPEPRSEPRRRQPRAVWSAGWDAEEAQIAREQRRERRRGR